jgi:hypothetical protein
MTGLSYVLAVTHWSRVAYESQVREKSEGSQMHTAQTPSCHPATPPPRSLSLFRLPYIRYSIQKNTFKLVPVETHTTCLLIYSAFFILRCLFTQMSIYLRLTPWRLMAGGRLILVLQVVGPFCSYCLTRHSNIIMVDQNHKWCSQRSRSEANRIRFHLCQ